MEDDGQWVVLLPGFIQQQFRLFPDMENKYVNRAKLTAKNVYTFYLNLIH